MSIKGTETEKNLLKSFAGESQARMRYTYFAEKARELEKKDMNKLLIFLLKLLKMKKNMLEDSLAS